ncbi:MAG: DUF1573 domain-containing protein [Candidatus Azobacteroides sp.]|nr:DUF1573 domain-containing protein [Candidatus Azobacteroides sp.]
MMKRKFIKFVLVIPALAGLFLLASVPQFSTKANKENFWYMTEDEITIDRPVHDFGTIKEDGGSVSATFIITNNTKASILITNVVRSCGCTAPAWTKEPIEPGQTGEVTATFDPRGRRGPFDKTITIITSGDPSRITARIKGVVE